MYLLAFVLIVAIIASYIGYRMSLATPDWYRPLAMSQTQLKQAANRGFQKLAALVDQAAALHADEVRRNAAHTQPAAAAPTSRPAESMDLSITSDELNALFDQWSKLNGWDEKLSRYVADPQVQLDHGQIILAGRVQQLGGRVVHVHFKPVLTDEGMLDLKVQGVWTGSLPLPTAAWDNQKEKLARAIRAPAAPATAGAARTARATPTNRPCDSPWNRSC